MQVQRTSSSRKARRKNEREGGQAFLGQCTDLRITETSWRVNAKLWIVEQLKNATTLCLAITCAIAYFCNTSNLFEYSTKFSQLTNAERELMLPTDFAFRYSFYKKIAQAESYLAGLRLITTDHHKDDHESTANSFQRHSLSPEAILGGGYHMMKILTDWTGWPQTNCYGRENSLRCSGLGDPLHFYFKSIWFLESFVVVFIFFLGIRFGKSVFGGLVSCALFTILHPQRSNYEWLFPHRDKMGWILVFCQLYCVSRTVFCRGHPHWSSTVKIGVCNLLLILGWNTEAQWLLTSQILIIAVLHIFGFYSRYVTSLIIFGGMTGWQYASLVSHDTSFHHWSFFLYTIMATVITIFILEPILDWILGKKIEKWTFLRRTILLVTLQIVLISVRCDFGEMFSFLEDSRFPLKINIMEEERESTWGDIAHLSSQLEKQDINTRSILQSSMKEQQDKFFVNQNPFTGSDSDPLDGGESQDGLEERVDFMPERIKNILSLQLTEFLRSCLHSQAKISLGKFLSKYFFLILAAMYTLIVYSLIPWVMSKPRGGKHGIFHFQHEDHERLIREREERGKWDFSWVSLLSLYREKEGMDDGENCRWSCFIIYHIVQTGFFGIFCMSLDKKGWEIFFVSHTSLIISLLCDFEKIKRTLNQCRFTYVNHLHFGFIVVIIGILVAISRVRLSQMYQKSRGHFEIGNPKIASLLEAHEWVKLNTENSAKFTGVDNLMVTLDLATERHSVNHHLTVHSWARENDHFEFYDKVSSETKSRRRGNPTRESGEKDVDVDERMMEKVESTKWDGMGGSVGLNSKPSSWGNGKSSWTIPHEDESEIVVKDGGGMRMTSVLTERETKSLKKIYSLFNRWESLQDFHQGLVSLNVSYLMLNSEQCATKQTSSHLSTTTSTTITPSITLSNRIQNGASKIPVTTLHKSHPSSGEIFVESSSPKILQQNSPSWQWNWQEDSGHNSPSFLPFSKNCDLVHFFDFVERKKVINGAMEQQNFKSHENSLTLKDFDSNVKGSYQRRGVFHPKINERQGDGKSNEAEESGEDQPTLCCRLLHERNVLPFKRVFQNSFFTILAI